MNNNTNTKSALKLKLTCMVSGKERPTTEAYIQSKAERLGVTTESIMANYAVKEVIKRLRRGETVAQIRTELGYTETSSVSDAQVEELLRVNGKSGSKK